MCVCVTQAIPINSFGRFPNIEDFFKATLRSRELSARLAILIFWESLADAAGVSGLLLNVKTEAGIGFFFFCGEIV